MTGKAIRLWPVVALPLLVLLGWAVGDGSTPIDDWFQRGRGSAARWLLFFTDYRTIVAILAATVVYALYRRRWPAALLTVVTPVLAVESARWAKRFFGRPKGDALAYPSGHITLMVVVLGMVILVVGARVWLVLAAAGWAVLGVLGQAVTYHYFTDTLGGVLLGTALVSIAAEIMRRASFTDASP
ncbi:MAG: PA-phosphatase [Mycobacterium sp.]|nr:PA-phosphatase [Mycobacterium sp.]